MLNPLLVDLPTIISDNDLRPPLPILELLASLVTQPNPQNPIEFIWRFCPSIVAKRGMGNPTSWRRLLRPASKCRRCKLPIDVYRSGLEVARTPLLEYRLLGADFGKRLLRLRTLFLYLRQIFRFLALQTAVSALPKLARHYRDVHLLRHGDHGPTLVEDSFTFSAFPKDLPWQVPPLISRIHFNWWPASQCQCRETHKAFGAETGSRLMKLAQSKRAMVEN